uniref:Family with sequence similarity 117 member Aa n=1 Tax=Poecilia mexicana TaxID=48701 RepID=A0A3B3YWB1_9TELE
MSGRNGAGHPRPGSLGPQPLKATVPFRLATGKPRLHQLSSGMRRTMSLDAIIGPYLQGHWPKEPEVHCGPSCKDKSTQVSRRASTSGSHRRSASWGSTEHLREVSLCFYSSAVDLCLCPQTQPVPIPLSPLSTLVPRLRCSVEGLNQELEGMFISQSPPPQHRVGLLEVPDGHRAPVPLHSCSSGSQSSTSAFQRCTPPQISSSPGLNKSFCFQREPPEGCEKVRVWEEIRYRSEAPVSSCPDPNKVNFTPHGGSAFCPVSLLKPLFPSMDLLIRSLTVSPVGNCSGQGTPSAGNRGASPDPAAASAVLGDASGEALAF